MNTPTHTATASSARGLTLTDCTDLVHGRLGGDAVPVAQEQEVQGVLWACFLGMYMCVCV